MPGGGPERVVVEAGLSRAQLLRRGATGAAVVLGLGAVGPYVRAALADAPETEIDALNLMLYFERIELEFYERGLRSFEGNGDRDLLALLDQLAEEERRHRDVLIAKIEEVGGKPIPKGNYAFAYPNSYEYLRLGEDLEVAGIEAYNGAIRALESQESKELAASIVQVEGRHRAAVRMQQGDEPVPDALDPGVQEYRARSSVAKFTGEY